MKKVRTVKKESESPWEKDLLKILTEMEIQGASPQLLEVAISEIIDGVKFCIRRKLKVQVTLENNFDIGNDCKCLLAKNGKDGKFFATCKRLHIKPDKVTNYGLLMSVKWQKVSEKINQNFDAILELWNQIYNILWKRTGVFFHENLQYKVK